MSSSSTPAHESQIHADYDLSTPLAADRNGLRQGLTSYGDSHFSLFLRKVFIKALGYSEDALSRPIIGIVNTYSSFNPCHANIPQLIDAVKRGVQLNGGLAIDFPTIKMIRAQPCDAVVLIGGCDKTTPAQLMGGLSANKPILHLVTGPMMPGSHKGTRIGACTDCRNNWASFRAGKIDIEDIKAINDELAPTAGTCGVMGTASTMACVLVGLGLMPFEGASAAAVSSARLRIAEQTGANAVAAWKKIRPQELLTRESFLNAITVLQAIGGSTNAVVHLMAIVGRHSDPDVRAAITLETVDRIGRSTPLLVDLKPSGENYMTDFHNSGGMLALLNELKPLLHLDARTISGLTLGEEIDKAQPRLFRAPRSVSCIQPLYEPLYPASSLVVLKGNLAPGGAVMKASASKWKHLQKHTGSAIVFAGSADLAKRLDNPNLEVTPDSVLVLQNIGPVGNPGMPEAGMIPIPRKLAAKGVLDMLRISDGRMSGTAGGSIILHVSPEAADPRSILGIVEDGDLVTCDVEKRLLHVDLTDEEIERRLAQRRNRLTEEEEHGEYLAEGVRSSWISRRNTRGYKGLYMRSVTQADKGADFDFLTASGPA
ncbi:dihydroxy-acid and 6-phosphogluconate dehydratase [Aspergillus insuetus]